MLDELTHMDRITQLQEGVEQLLIIMSSSITYLTQKSTFKQISDQIPITRTRPAEKVDSVELFESTKRELISELVRKAKQVELLINSLPAPEPENQHVARLAELQDEMAAANEEYRQAVNRARDLHRQISTILKIMLSNET